MGVASEDRVRDLLLAIVREAQTGLTQLEVDDPTRPLFPVLL